MRSQIAKSQVVDGGGLPERNGRRREPLSFELCTKHSRKGRRSRIGNAFCPIRMMTRNTLFALLATPVLALCQVEALGTVVDAGSELPIPKVRIFSPDSSFLTSSNDQGHWELRLKRPIEVTFRKEGYRDQVLALADVTNLLDIVIDLEPLGSALEGRVVRGKGAPKAVQVGSIEAIEQMSGMRMDLQEHLRNLPGISGVREFSSEVSVYGSRTQDVTHILGPFQIPNLRHLDFSFPGNESVLNPRVLQGITVEHDPTKGPLEQGLASALRYQPIHPATDRYEGILSWGLTNREIDLFGPIGNGTFTASGRWLAPSTINHMADKFFVGGRDANPNAPKDTSTQPISKVDLQAFDGYARVEQGIGPMALSVTALGASDDHSVALWSHRNISNDNLPITDPRKSYTDHQDYYDIQRGTKLDFLAFAEAQGDLSSGWLDVYGGSVYGNQALQLSDTLQRANGFQTANGIPPTHEMDWSATTLDRSDWRVGGSFRPTWLVMGMEPEILSAVDYIEEQRQYGIFFNQGVGSDINYINHQSDDFAYLRSRSSIRLRGKEDKTEWGFAAGGLWAQDAGLGAEATASLMTPWMGFGWLANLSMRANEATEATTFAKYGVRQVLSKEAKVGVGRSFGPIEVSGTTYWRSIDQPELPKADFLWVLPHSQTTDQASVLGGTFQAKWTSWHPLQIQTNLSRVQGEYALTNGATMAWEANRDFDAWTLIKFHPRTDTMISIILSHSASLGKPYYRFRIDTVSRTISVQEDPAAPDGAKVRDQYRTDIRTELQIPTNLAPFRQIRFYAEVQNLFGQFEGDWARALGGNNYRARSWTPIHATPPSGSLIGADPLYASGTDLFFSFGIEGRLGI